MRVMLVGQILELLLSAFYEVSIQNRLLLNLEQRRKQCAVLCATTVEQGLDRKRLHGEESEGFAESQ
jgi:hypothetical protein